MKNQKKNLKRLQNQELKRSDSKFIETIIGDMKYIYILTKNGYEFYKSEKINN